MSDAASPVIFIADSGECCGPFAVAAEERPGEFTDRLLVQWKRAPGSHVAFFSLEKSGAKGQGKKEHVFTEVHRDPPNADANGFENGFLVTGLDPDTTYTFRLRAFNGFGPGPYTWKTFTTQPKRPPPPAGEPP